VVVTVLELVVVEGLAVVLEGRAVVLEGVTTVRVTVLGVCAEEVLAGLTVVVVVVGRVVVEEAETSVLEEDAVAASVLMLTLAGWDVVLG
jgi:hypothetical protein